MVYSSVGGAERNSGVPHFESKRRVEERLESLDLATTFVRPTFFMENLTLRPPAKVEDGVLVMRFPLAATTPLQMIAARDIGRVAVAALLDPDRVGGSIEIAGDEKTCEQIAAALATQAGIPGRFEPIDRSSIPGGFDRQAMFAWLDEPPSYRADFAATKRLVPDLYNLERWLVATETAAPDLPL